MSTDDVNKALNRAYFFLKFRPRSEKEMSDYLNKKSERYRWQQETVNQTIVHLKDIKLLDDDEFIRWFVDQRSRHRQKSRYVLSQELLRYGVPIELIDNYFASHEINEEELAEEALRKRWSKFEALPSKDQFTKASQFLARRGFSFETAKKTIAKIRGRE
jgi:regulatory protein